jgi:hypothetical protein
MGEVNSYGHIGIEPWLFTELRPNEGFYLNPLTSMTFDS